MVSHQYLGMNAVTVLAGMLAQPIQMDRVNSVGEEAGLAIVLALDNVQEILGKIRPARRGME